MKKIDSITSVVAMTIKYYVSLNDEDTGSEYESIDEASKVLNFYQRTHKFPDARIFIIAKRNEFNYEPRTD